MLLAGGSLAFATAAIPDMAEGSALLIVATGSAAVLLGAVLVMRPHLFPEWATPWFVALGTVLVTLSTQAAGVRETDNEVFYLMAILYSFYFLSRREAFLQLAVVAVAYGWLLLSEITIEMAVARWVTTIGTLLVAGLFVRTLNSRVEELVDELDSNARLDPLTGTLNRRGLDERLGIEISRARRTGEPLTALTVDLDGLKAINDRHGHGAGDEALELAAEVMADSLRDLDVLARTGGDEFVLLLPGCDPSTGLDIAENLLAEVRRRSERESWPVTVSVGVAAAPPLPLDPEALIVAGDSALYRAKALGRDRASLAGRAELRRALRVD